MTELSALSAVPVGSRDGVLRFYFGPMDCGKSTLALQMNYNHGRQGRRGLVLTKHDRSGGPQVTSRIGLGSEAVEVVDDLDLVALVRDGHERIDYVICDEACFYTVAQIEQLADLTDDFGIDVYAFGLASDFRSQMFPAAQRLFELADEINRLQVEVLCWCGRPGRLNARVVGGDWWRDRRAGGHRRHRRRPSSPLPGPLPPPLPLRRPRPLQLISRPAGAVSGAAGRQSARRPHRGRHRHPPAARWRGTSRSRRPPSSPASARTVIRSPPHRARTVRRRRIPRRHRRPRLPGRP